MYGAWSRKVPGGLLSVFRASFYTIMSLEIHRPEDSQSYLPDIANISVGESTFLLQPC